MLVEVAGVSPSDLKELVAKQGKFEARIVFVIPQFYVVPRTVCFDKVVLQNEGFLFRIGDDGIDVRHLF